MTPRAREWPGKGAVVATAAFVTIVDGFDAFSMSLAAPAIARDLNLSTAALGPIFASTMGGMIVGAFGGGALADKIGRLRALLVALLLFGTAALLIPFTSTLAALVVNRVIAGVGLGAAAPIAVALLNNRLARPPSDLVVSIVWGGIAIGGILAAAFSYMIVPEMGWQSLFIAGGILPFGAAVAASIVFRGRDSGPSGQRSTERPRVGDLFAHGRAGPSIGTLAMFFFGYVTTSIILNWLPTVLDHGGASPAMISTTFAAINVGSAVGTFALGFLSTKFRSRYNLVGTWAVAGLCSVAASLSGSLSQLALFAILAGTVAAGSQALSVAFANRLHRGCNLESTTVGLMVSGGRIGQFAALGLSGLLLAAGISERDLFAFAGGSASIAAIIALVLARRNEADRDRQPQ